MKRAQVKLTRHKILLEELPSVSKSIYFEVVTTGVPNCLLYLGFGNERRSVMRTARLLAAYGIGDVAVVAPLPYWLVPGTRRHLDDVGQAGAIAAARLVASMGGGHTLHAVAESQAAPVLVYAANAEPQLFSGRISLIHPLGIVQMGPGDYKRRAVAGALQADQFADWRSYPVASWIAYRTLQDALQSGHRLRHAMATDVRQPLQTLAKSKGQDLRIVASDNDRIYPPLVMEQALRQLGINDLLNVVAGSHASPASKAGAKKVADAILWCRSQQ